MISKFKYVQLKNRKDGILIDRTRYEKYIKSIKSRLSKQVYNFASNSKYYNFENHSSLHDAWLQYFNIKEIAKGKRSQYRRTDIESCYLGPYHDRRIIILYKDVQSIFINTVHPLWSAHGWAHGDLITHEVRLDKDKFLVHTIVYSTESIFVIKCRNIIHREIKIPRKSRFKNAT